MKLEGGEKRFIYMERLQCTNKGCNKLHNALPDKLVPYKHYAADVISGILDEVITRDDLEAEDYPCEATMLRWKHWLIWNYFRIDGYLKSIGHRFLGFSDELLNTQCRLSGKVTAWHTVPRSGKSILKEYMKKDLYWTMTA